VLSEKLNGEDRAKSIPKPIMQLLIEVDQRAPFLGWSVLFILINRSTEFRTSCTVWLFGVPAWVIPQLFFGRIARLGRIPDTEVS